MSLTAPAAVTNAAVTDTKRHIKIHPYCVIIPLTTPSFNSLNSNIITNLHIIITQATNLSQQQITDKNKQCVKCHGLFATLKLGPLTNCSSGMLKNVTKFRGGNEADHTHGWDFVQNSTRQNCISNGPVATRSSSRKYNLSKS